MNLELLNQQIKDEGKKFSLVVYRDKFQLRGTFRFQNGIKKRAYINLDVPAEESNIREAKKRLDQIQYSIEDFGCVPDRLPFEKVVEPSKQSKQITCKEAKELFIDYWWAGRCEYKWWEVYNEDGKTRNKKLEQERRKNASVVETRALNSWQGITPYINKLDDIANAPLSVGALYQIAKGYKNARGRKEIVMRFQKIIELCKRKGFDIGGEVYDLDDLKMKYTPKTKPNFQDDEFIRYVIEIREKLPKWKWCIGALLVWGVRPSETFGLTPLSGEEFGLAHVLGLKEEGEGLEERTALGCPKYLIEEFNLLEIDRPYTYNNFDKSYNALTCKQLTNKWAEDLRELIKKEPEFKKFTLYAIRHSYARRIIKRGKASVVGSKSMGNDIKIFEETYLKAMDRKDFIDLQKDL